mgnify:FL=1|tara:strand:+ start:2623 stop:2874 length:252 start_codon:yes stop_codon:yes gene_type:complete
MKNLTKVIETYINGNITTAKKEIENISINGIDIVECSCLFGVPNTVKILKKLDIIDLHIINAFYDYDSGNLDEVKQILLNNFY